MKINKNGIKKVFGTGILFATALSAFLEVFADDKRDRDVEALKKDNAYFKKEIEKLKSHK